MALRQLNMQLAEEDMLELFAFFDKDGSGVCEVPRDVSTTEPTHLPTYPPTYLRTHLLTVACVPSYSPYCSLEVREILSMLKAEPTPEEAQWQQVGIGKQTLTPTRDVHVRGVRPSAGQSGFARSDNPTHPMKWQDPGRARGKPPGPGGVSSWPPALPIFR